MASICRITCSFATVLVYFLLISGISARNVQTLHEKSTQISTFSELSNLAGSGSGRSLFLIKSFLLAPLGIALLILAGLTLIPIPVVSTGRAFNDNSVVNLAKRVMYSEECVERVACEISNLTKKSNATSWIPQSVENYIGNSQLRSKLSRGFNMDRSCKEFSCNPTKSISKNYPN